jgi:hypothetical protein
MENQTSGIFDGKNPKELYDVILEGEDFGLNMRFAVRNKPLQDLPTDDILVLKEKMSNGLIGLDYIHTCFMKSLDLKNANPNYEAAKTYFALTLNEINSEINSRRKR